MATHNNSDLSFLFVLDNVSVGRTLEESSFYLNCSQR